MSEYEENDLYEVDTDDGGLYVNFSDEEAASESRDMEPLPTGKYLVTITDVTLKECGSESKNPGKPYYAIEFTVVADKKGGTFVNRKCWTNAMLFNPALYTISNLMKALGLVPEPGRFKVPGADFFVGKTIMIGGLHVPEQKDKRDPSKVYAPKYEPKGFWPETAWTGQAGTATAKSGTTRSSLLS